MTYKGRVLGVFCFVRKLSEGYDDVGWRGGRAKGDWLSAGDMKGASGAGVDLGLDVDDGESLLGG